MSKIVQAANVMISRKNLITDVTPGEEEIFFKYNKKYIWSIAQREADIYLWYYPNAGSIDAIMEQGHHESWENIPMVLYRATDVGTREAIETFTELFRVVKEKLFGVDDVLDDIIKDDPF